MYAYAVMYQANKYLPKPRCYYVFYDVAEWCWVGLQPSACYWIVPGTLEE